MLSKVLKNKKFEDINVDHNIVKDKDYKAPHLNVSHGAIKPVVLVVGDPFRVEIVAS